MTLLLTIPYRHDLYEIHLRDNHITRIVKYCGDSQYRRELVYRDLPDGVKTLITKQLETTFYATSKPT